MAIKVQHGHVGQIANLPCLRQVSNPPHVAAVARRQRIGRRRAARRGAAVLEFAILLPWLLTIALLCVDFGRFAHYYIAVTNAARAGAGYASNNLFTPATKPRWDAAVRQAVVDELTENPPNRWFDASKLTIPAPLMIQEGGGYWRVQVDVSYPFQTLINWPFLDILGGRKYNEPLILHRRVVMRGTI